ncbi:hypothetical protein [Actinomadura sp.]
MNPVLIPAAIDNHQIRHRIGGQQHLQRITLGFQHLGQRDWFHEQLR